MPAWLWAERRVLLVPRRPLIERNGGTLAGFLHFSHKCEGLAPSAHAGLAVAGRGVLFALRHRPINGSGGAPVNVCRALEDEHIHHEQKGLSKKATTSFAPLQRLANAARPGVGASPVLVTHLLHTYVPRPGPTMMRHHHRLSFCAPDLVLPVRLGARDGGLRLQRHERKAAVLRAVALVARHVHVHNVPKAREVLLRRTGSGMS